ncbi:MAG: glycosyltransferase family 2 protein [Acidobacteriia bacterium]|nr:glycosyltransferase family 2 protein [Terriglobia bacterium]
MRSLPAISDNPLVSVIVPSFNQGRFIRETLDSILQQDYRPLEVIVVDGASTDNTVEILHRFDEHHEITWTSEPDSGVVEAVNKGLQRARGEIGAIQSSDDFYLPGAITRAVQALRNDSSLGFIFGDIIKIDADGAELSRTSLKPFSLEILLSVQTWIPQPSTFFRLELARELGGWQEGIPFAADTGLWYRMAFQANAKKIDETLAARRVHPGQRDTHGDRIVRDYCRMIETLGDLKHASSRVRRAARAGKLLMKNRYGPSSYWKGFFRQWGAVLLYPPLCRHLDPFSLAPGWYFLRRWISEVR